MSSTQSISAGERGAISLEHRLFGFSLIAAPLLLSLSTFSWEDGKLGLYGGTLQVYSFLFWILSYLGLSRLVRPALPRFSVIGILAGVFGSIGGINFGTDGVYGEAVLAAGGSADLAGSLIQGMGPMAPLILFLPGLFFPLSLLIHSIALWRAKAAPAWVAALLAAGAALFPASRIPRIEAVAHAADLALFLPLAWLGWRYLSGKASVD